MALRIVWFNQILRVSDHPALVAAARKGQVLPVFILDPERSDGRLDPLAGGAKRWWLHGALHELGDELAVLGSPLIIRSGPTVETLATLCREAGASGIDLTRPFDPLGRDRLSTLRSRLSGVDLQAHAGATLFLPAELRNASGQAFQVFTPFWKALRALGEPSLPLPAPAALDRPSVTVTGLGLDELGLTPRHPDWAGGLRRTWTPGSRAGRARLSAFLADGLSRYATDRDYPARDGASELSPYLASGELSVREAWHAVRAVQRARGVSDDAAEAWLRQLAWREFAWHLLDAHPYTLFQPLRPQYAAFPWRDDPESFAAWTRGETGYPLVDAGMRQLWETGWMPNRVRMVVASFLVKHLLIPWQQGARWFEDTLVDADLASNVFGWQWVAGSGADGAPYFRVFNPLAQAKTFDPDGAYIARWIPELAALPPALRHQPWQSSVERGAAETYPRPIIEHAWARNRALQAFAAMKES